MTIPLTVELNRIEAAVGMAVLDEIERLDLCSNVASVGVGSNTSLSQHKGASDAIGDVRGHGLFVCVETVSPADGAPDADLAKRVINVLRDKGFLTSFGSRRPHRLAAQASSGLTRHQHDHSSTGRSDLAQRRRASCS